MGIRGATYAPSSSRTWRLWSRGAMRWAMIRNSSPSVTLTVLVAQPLRQNTQAAASKGARQTAGTETRIGCTPEKTAPVRKIGTRSGNSRPRPLCKACFTLGAAFLTAYGRVAGRGCGSADGSQDGQPGPAGPIFACFLSRSRAGKKRRSQQSRTACRANLVLLLPRSRECWN